MEPFKNIFNKKSILLLAGEIDFYFKDFNKSQFTKTILPSLESLEMKQRVKLIASAFNEASNSSTQTNLEFLYNLLNETRLSGFMLWPFSQYLEEYTLDFPEKSLACLYVLTQKFTAEFAIRSYLIVHERQTINHLQKWQTDPSEHVRRLVSEGTRPKLPWGRDIPSTKKRIKENMELILPLATDSSEYVRRSVANHLNDVSKINEQLFFSSLNQINQTRDKNSQKLIRHAARTLLKRGHPKALKLHQYNVEANLKVEFKLDKNEINEGDRLNVYIQIKNKNMKKENLLIDYIIHYLKKNGQHSQKVFRLKDTVIKEGEIVTFSKTIHFKKVTTRVHYPGVHFMEVQINGKKYSKRKFNVSI